MPAITKIKILIFVMYMIILRNEICDKLENIVKNLKFVRHCIGCEGINLDIENPHHHPSIELTQKCNLNCIYCYSRLKTVERGIYGNLEEAEAVTISQYGEPLLDLEGVKKAIEFCKDLGLRVDLQTNGTLLNEEIIKELKDLGLDLIMISLSAFSSERYKLLTGKDYFDIVLNNIKTASKYLHTIVRAIYIPGFNDNELLNLAKELNGYADEIMVHQLISYKENEDLLKNAGIDLSNLGRVRDLLLIVNEMQKNAPKINVTIKGCLLVQLKEMDGFILNNITYDVFSEVPDIKRDYKPIPW
ncbi:Radical SAM domain protein [Methanocaldococcus sp. FS406-22]|nr:Radical SAM domain protein [Methanocaldococcus sp. FS406-22]